LTWATVVAASDAESWCTCGACLAGGTSCRCAARAFTRPCGSATNGSGRPMNSTAITSPSTSLAYSWSFAYTWRFS